MNEISQTASAVPACSEPDGAGALHAVRTRWQEGSGLPAPLADWLLATLEERLHRSTPLAAAVLEAQAAAALPAGWPPAGGVAAALARLDAMEVDALVELLEADRLDAATLRDASEVFGHARHALAAGLEAPQAAGALNLQQALAARDRHLSVATHELRTPISSILLNLQLLERAARTQGTLDGAAVTRLLAIPSRQLRRLMRMVDLLLDAAQVESERLVLHRQRLDLCLLVHEAVARVQPLAQAASCTVDLAACVAVRGNWDKLRLEQVVTNLVTNGIKYGGGHVAVRTWQADGRAWIEVRDDGQGMPQEDQERIFEPYLRLPSNAAEEGAGLGLYIVREIVVAHGGRIAVASRPGAGATFTVELPL